MNQSGFNLVELLVAIGIFVILLAVTVVNFRGASPRQSLSLQAENIISVLRQAQSDAGSGLPFGGSIPIGGYGVQIDTCDSPECSIILFADSNGNFTPDTPDEIIQTIPLGNEVILKSISSGSPSIFTFKPPAGFVCVNGSCAGDDIIQIILGVRNSTDTMMIRINPLTGNISL